MIYAVYFSRVCVYLLLIPLLIHRLEDQWAIFAIVLSFIQLATTAVEFGFGISGTKDVAQNQEDYPKLRRIVTDTLIVQIVMIFCVCVFSVVLKFTLDLNITELALVILIFSFQGLNPLWFLKGVECIEKITLSELVSKLTVLILVYFYVYSTKDLTLLLSIYFFGALTPSLVGYAQIFRKYGFPDFKLSQLQSVKRTANYGSLLFGVRLSAMFVNVGGSLLLGLFGFVALAGQFAIIERIISGVRNILLPAWEILFPRLLALRKTNLEESKKFKQFVGYSLAVFASGAGILMYVFSAEIVGYFSPHDSGELANIISTLGMVPLIVALINNLGLNDLVAQDHEVEFFKAIFLGSLSYVMILSSILFYSEGNDQLINHIAYSYQISLSISLIIIFFYTRVASKNVGG